MTEDSTAGWSAVPNWIIRDSDLTAYELLVFIALLNRANKRGESWPSYSTLQREARASKDTVIRALRTLENRGLVEVISRRKPDGSNASNLYRVDVHERGSLTATGVVAHSDPLVAHSDGGSRSQRPEVLHKEVLPIEVQPNEDLARSALTSAFEAAYAHWPKKANRKTAEKRFEAVAKKRPVAELVADIQRFGDAYASTTTKRFVPGLDSWLLKERWTDDLPEGDSRDRTGNAISTIDAGARLQALADRRAIQ